MYSIQEELGPGLWIWDPPWWDGETVWLLGDTRQRPGTILAVTTWRGDATGIEWVEASAQVGPATEGCPAQSARPTQILGDAVS